MNRNTLKGCSLCRSIDSSNLLKLNCGNLDNSRLYKIARIVACNKCGHIYNRLTSKENKGLIIYYNEEYGPLNINSTDKIGDRPGSSNLLTSIRHSQLFSLLSPYVKQDFKVLDIGCALGGFLDFLKKQGLKNLYGIDVIEKYVDQAKKKFPGCIKLGNADSIPFNNNLFNLVIADQVLEHLSNPMKVFNEAKRVLKDDGLLCIGVPDASRYKDLFFFDYYWFLMREHIQHFDIYHLMLLANQEGFEILGFSLSETPIVNNNMMLPNLNVIFRKTKFINNPIATSDLFKLKANILTYIVESLRRSNKKRELIINLINQQVPLYVWGIGREFLYLYSTLGMDKCHIIGFIDGNRYKQKNFTINGKKISDNSILINSNKKSALIITAMAYKNQIKSQLVDIDYKGQIINL